MMYLLKILLYCFCLTTLNVRVLKADGSFEDADQVNEFITMSFSSSHPYDLRQTIPGEPEIDYPIYSAVPRTNFDCNGRHEGYYADTEARCQVFRICANTDLVGRGFAFLCPNGTLFSQKNFVCDWYRNVDCNDSERFYSKNDNNRIGSKTDMMNTVRQMMEHPMKTISIALSRGKSTTPQPRIQTNFATIPTKAPKNFQIISSSSPASVRIPTTQNNFNRGNQEINIKEGESASRFSSPLQETPITGQNKITTTASASEEGFKPINIATLNITPPSPTFTPPFETPISETYGNTLPSENISFDAFSSATQAGSPLSTTEDSASEKQVYVSSLGELSTDPGANFNRQTSNVIADSPSNALDTETKPLKVNGMNFAEKVNAGLNGLQVVNQDEIIAPEYVKNIMQNNGDLADETIQPVSFDFASNINGLLDEVNYEAQLEAQNSVQLQPAIPQSESSLATKKPFRFLSRGFSHDKSKDDGPYNYKPTSSPRSTFRTTQHSTSTQSYSNSLITTLLTTTQPPVTSTESSQILALENASENPSSESAINLNTQSEAPSFESNQSNNLVEDKNKSSILETVQHEQLAESQLVNKIESELENKLESKPAIKREPKELKQLDSIATLKDLSQELNDEDKLNANKRAEDLLLAGVKQITVNEPDESSKTTEEELNSSIVPIYNRVTATQTSASHITSSSTTSAISTTTTSSTMPTSEYSSSTDVVITSSSTPTVTPVYYPEPSTTPAVSIRRFTVGSGKRRQTSRPISYSRRNNSQRSGLRSTSTTKPASSTSIPTHRGRSGVRSTSTTTAPNTTKITISPRKRVNGNRYTYGSRRRTTETLSSTSATTTTAAPSNKKLNDRSSDSALSDLTGAASTYNGVSNRAYNSIRQNSNKYTQVKRRHPSNKNIASQTTTTKPLLKNSTTQQPRSSSSYPTPTLAPFSHHEALSPMPTSSTTPAPLPATYLSFNDLTKSITDDSILQTLRKNQAFNKQLIDSTAFRSQQQALPRQQIPFSTQPRIQQVDYSTQRPPLQVPTKLPFIPLKDFIASKFGAQYSPEPPKLSTGRPTLISQNFNNDFVSKPQNKPVVDQQYTKQQYGGVRQEFLPQTNQAIKLSTPVQYTVRTPFNQNVNQQQSQQQQQTHQQQLQQTQHQQQQQQQQYQEQQLRLQQQQQKLQQLKQQQNHLQQQYQLQQQQKLQQQKQQQQQQQQIQQQQKPQQHQVPPQQFFSPNQQQIVPTQQYSQFQQAVPILEPQQQQQQQQKLPIQQQRNSVHLVSTKIVPSVEQQFQIQRSQQIQQPISLPPQQQQRQQPQYQIIPSQMTVAQTIPPQQTNIKAEIGSINVRLPSNLAGLIPNSNIFDLSRDSNSLDSAQRRSDQTLEDAYGARERKSFFTGVSSYEVPLSSVGRLTNDITNLLRRL